MARRAAIIGVGQTHHSSKRPDVSSPELVNEAVRRALEDAQISVGEIEAVVMANMNWAEGWHLPDLITSDFIGAHLKPTLKFLTGGCMGLSTTEAAWHHVASGVFDVVMAVACANQGEHEGTTARLLLAADPLVERPFASGAIGVFALFAQQYMRRSGCREEHAAMVRVKADENACRNPYAHLKLGITIEAVLNSRVLVWPLRILHMCPQSSGACALILASEERAKRAAKKPVWIKDHVTVLQESWRKGGFEGGVTPTTSSQSVATARLYKRNGITNPIKEIGLLEMYEPSSWAELLWMEEFHLCERGEAWRLVEKGVTRRDGAFPINPSGGVVSTNPAAASAMIRVAECVLQLRGEAGEHQVTKAVKTALAHGFGGTNWTELMLLSTEM